MWPSTRRRAAFAAAIPAATRGSERATDIQFVISPLATTSGHDSIGAILSMAKRSASSGYADCGLIRATQRMCAGAARMASTMVRSPSTPCDRKKNRLS